MSLYEELGVITPGEARLAVGTVFAQADSEEVSDSDFMSALGNVLEIPSVAELYDSMCDGIMTTEGISNQEKESSKVAVLITLTSLTILAKAKRDS